MKIIHKINIATKKINLFFSYLGMYFLIPMMIITSIDVISRSIFSLPIGGSIEVSKYMFATLILLNLGYTEEEKNNVKVGFVLSKFSPRIQSIVDSITTLLSLLIISIMAWQGFIVAIHETTVSYILRIPEAPFRLLVSFGSILLAIVLMKDFINACYSSIRR